MEISRTPREAAYYRLYLAQTAREERGLPAVRLPWNGNDSTASTADLLGWAEMVERGGE